jgi:hypothetical protein
MIGKKSMAIRLMDFFPSVQQKNILSVNFWDHALEKNILSDALRLVGLCREMCLNEKLCLT